MRCFLTGCPFLGCLVALAGCVSNGGLDGGALSMKGYELYSWPAEQDWNFALMVGTNRIKTLEEITSPQSTLHGVEALKTTLRALPAKEQVFWMGAHWLEQSQAASGSIAIPPSPIRDEITTFCSQLGIKLTVDD